MDGQLEERVRACKQCQITRHSPAKVPLHPWEWPQRPWSRIHIDHAGPFLGKMFLLVIDAHSKWMEITVVASTTSHSTIEELRKMFATHGLPEVLVSDNGTAFSSADFHEFTRRNSIRHVRMAPYHPSSNGQVERAVQTFKDAMKKESPDTLNTRISRFLFHYRNTPHTTTGVSPAELLMGRQLRTHLSLLIPSTTSKVARKQEDQKQRYDRNTKYKSFIDGETVLIRDFSVAKEKWIMGEVHHRSGPMSYNIRVNDGRIVRRHIDHIKSYTPGRGNEGEYDEYQDEYSQTQIAIAQEINPGNPEHESTVHTEPPQLRRSVRVRYPPKRYEPDV